MSFFGKSNGRFVKKKIDWEDDEQYYPGFLEYQAEEAMRATQRDASDETAAEPSAEEDAEVPTDGEQDNSAGVRKGRILLGISCALLLSAVIMSAVVIARSANREDVRFERQPNPIRYAVAEQPPQVTEGLENAMTPPKSLYGSNRVNILLIGMDRETGMTDTLIVAGLDMEAKEVSFLSIPRDTYVSGNYEVPKINRIYSTIGEERGIDALKENIKDMFGFWTDHYFVLDSDAVECLTELAGEPEFVVTEAAAYTDIAAGKRKLNAETAMALLTYDEEYEEVEAESTEVQRMLLQKLFGELVRDQENVVANAQKLCEEAETDLTWEQLAHMGYLLRSFDFERAYSQSLPGKEINVDEMAYFEVNAEDAMRLLNKTFNPLEEMLTEYDVHFRQEKGASGEGNMTDFGFPGFSGGGTNDDDDDVSENPDEQPTEDPDEQPTEDSGEQPTENPDEQPTEDGQDPTTDPEPPTEPPAPTEAPVPTESPAPTEYNPPVTEAPPVEP